VPILRGDDYLSCSPLPLLRSGAATKLGHRGTGPARSTPHSPGVPAGSYFVNSDVRVQNSFISPLLCTLANGPS
jgi:hypothetical protein